MGLTRILALDTSTWWAGVALVEGDATTGRGDCIAESRALVRDSHSARLLPLVDAVLTATGWSRDSIGAYAAVRGPGSFTGIRIGLGILRGLAIASARPCVGIGTLEAMAEAFGAAGADRVPLLDAGRSEVFGARFDPVGSPPRTVTSPWVGPPEQTLETAGGRCVVFGSGAHLYAARLRAAGLECESARSPESIAAAAGKLALLRLAGGAADGEGMSPLYLRPADAEVPR